MTNSLDAPGWRLSFLEEQDAARQIRLHVEPKISLAVIAPTPAIRTMTEIWFYHLQRRPIERVLPNLI
jgi:hypothetical protein